MLNAKKTIQEQTQTGIMTERHSTGSDDTQATSRKLIQHLMKDLNLLDIWRHLNPDMLEGCEVYER